MSSKKNGPLWIRLVLSMFMAVFVVCVWSAVGWISGEPVSNGLVMMVTYLIVNGMAVKSFGGDDGDDDDDDDDGDESEVDPADYWKRSGMGK